MISSRNPGSDKSGRSFTIQVVEAVWQKGSPIAGYDPGAYRRDRCGKTIARVAHGTTGLYGWEVDHIRPVAKGGQDDLDNLEPLYWENNRHKSDDYPNWSCKIRD